MSKGLSGGEGCLLIILFVLVAFAITFVFGGIILQAGWNDILVYHVQGLTRLSFVDAGWLALVIRFLTWGTTTITK